MKVTVIDTRGMRTTFKNAKVNLSDKTLMIHAPDENGEMILHNFVLQNVIYYVALRENNEKE